MCKRESAVIVVLHYQHTILHIWPNNTRLQKSHDAHIKALKRASTVCRVCGNPQRHKASVKSGDSQSTCCWAVIRWTENTGMMPRSGGSVSCHNPAVRHYFHMGIGLGSSRWPLLAVTQHHASVPLPWTCKNLALWSQRWIRVLVWFPNKTHTTAPV